MPIQRSCGAEIQERNKLSNGPRRAQSNVFLQHRVFCDVRHTLVARDMMVS